MTVTADLINQLSYTDRLIKETLRLFPIIPLITRVTRCDMKIGKIWSAHFFQWKENYWIFSLKGKYDIPTGTEFIMSIFDLHRKTSIWGPDAGKFDPNNFLPENVAQRHPHSFVPFSFGSRNCIGIPNHAISEKWNWNFGIPIFAGARYANIVVRLIVASLVRNFIFTTEEKFENLRLKWAITLKLENGHFVKLMKRNFSWIKRLSAAFHVIFYLLSSDMHTPTVLLCKS